MEIRTLQTYLISEAFYHTRVGDSAFSRMRKVTFKPARVLGDRCGSDYHVIVVTSSRPQAAKCI